METGVALGTDGKDTSGIDNSGLISITFVLLRVKNIAQGISKWCCVMLLSKMS